MRTPSRLAPALLTALMVACGGSGSVPPLEAARAHADEGRWRSASIEARNAVAADAGDAPARRLLGRLQLRLGDPVSAEKELGRARELDPGTDVGAPLALALLRQGRPDEVLRIEPSDAATDAARARLLALRALASAATGDRDAASRTLTGASALAPDLPEIALAEARLLLGSGDAGAALTRLETLASALDASGGTTGAGDADDAFAFGPHAAETHELIGDLHRAAGRAEAAKASYARALDVAVVDVPIRVKLASLALDTDDRETLLAELETLERRALEMPLLGYLRGRIELADGDLLAAQSRFEEVLTRSPDDPGTLTGLTLVHLGLGNDGQADQYAKRLSRLSDGGGGGAMLGLVRLRRGDLDGAVTAVEPVVRHGRPDALAIKVLTTALLAADEPVRAADLLLARAGNTRSTDAAAPLPELAFTGDPVRELLRSPDGTGSAATGAETTRSDAPAETADGANVPLDARRLAHARALALLVRGRPDEAHALLAGVLETYPADAPTRLLDALSLALGDDLDGAIDAAERVRAERPGDRSAASLLARAALADGDPETARALLSDRALEGEPLPEDWLLAARADAAAGDERAALETLRRGAEQYPEEAGIAVPLASAAAVAGDADGALRHLDALPDDARRRPDVRRVRAAALVELARHADALVELDALLAGAPGDASLHYLRSRTRAALEDGAGLREDLDAALAADPDHALALDASARVALVDGRPDDARALRDRLAERLGEEDERVVALADAVDGAGPVAGSRTVEITTAEDLVAAASALWRGGERDRALELMLAWLETRPGDVPVHLTLANAYMTSGRDDDAVAAYERALEHAPDDLVALNNAAWLLRETAPERAFELARRATEVAPESAAALDTLAMLALALGRDELAVSSIDRALELAPDDPSIRLNAASIAARTGAADRARERLEALLDDAPDGPERAEAEALLLSLDDER